MPIVTVPGDAVQTFRVFVTLPADAITARAENVTFAIAEVGENGESMNNPTTFQTGLDE
jgi:hypothetical protein